MCWKKYIWHLRLALLSGGFICLVGGLFAQNASTYGDSILWKSLRPHIAYLTSDSLEGREAGTRGEALATAYLQAQMQEMGLLPIVPEGKDSVYRQAIPLTRSQVKDAWLKVGENRLEHLKEVICWSGTTRGRMISMEPRYLGAGTAEDFEEEKVSRKAVIIRCSAREIQERYRLAQQAGVGACLIVTAEDKDRFEAQKRLFQLMMANPKSSLSGTQGRIPLFVISPQTAAQILKVSEQDWRKGKVKPPKRLARIELSIEQERVETPAYNLLGWIPGTEQPEEVLVISAHYDHLGIRRGNLYPGADDNAAGIAALLEVAQAFRQAAEAGFPPRRSLLFIAFSAEEKGLLGSKLYAKAPLFPFEQTLANLNMDMIGHLDDEHREKPRFVSVVGSDWLSQDLHQIHEAANTKHVQLELDYAYNRKNHPERFYYRSDQYNFARNGVPVIFYTSGDHEDYHKPTDTLENLVPERVEAVAQLVFYTAWEIVYRAESLRRDE